MFSNQVQLSRRQFNVGTGMAVLSTFGLTACGGGSSDSPVVNHQLYTQTNENFNAVAHLTRSADGSITLKNLVGTGGAGANPGPDALVSDNSLIISDDKSTLFVVNAGSNSVSSFSIDPSTGDLVLIGSAPVDGVLPTSLAYQNNVLYVLLQGSRSVQALSVANKKIGASIGTYAIPGLVVADTPSSIVLSPNSPYLVVSIKGVQSIVSYLIGSNGSLSAPVANTNFTGSSFAGAFKDGYFFNLDPGNKAVQSLSFDKGVLTPNGAEVGGLPGAPCWIAITPNGRFLYTGNGGGTISLFSIGASGALTLVAASAANDSAAVAGDLWISPEGQFLYAAYYAAKSIQAYSINPTSGALTKVGTAVVIQSTLSMMGLFGV